MVPRASGRRQIELSFLAHRRTVWRDVKVVIGNAYVNVRRVSGGKVARLWRDHNPG